MKPQIQLAMTVACLMLSHVAIHGATNYWDIDGPIPGAGGPTPAGLWDTGLTTNWSAAALGNATATTWTSGNDAIFSAGTNATNAFAVTVDATQTAGNLMVKEGAITFSGGTSLNIGGGVAGKGIITIGSGLTTTIGTTLEGGNDLGQITKAGAGTLVLTTANPSLGGEVYVGEGTLVLSNATALGSTISPTTVSNGATLRASINVAIPEPIILNGPGVANGGALRCTISPPQANGWSGGATLTSPSRINLDASGTWTWTVKAIVATNAGGSYNLTVGGNGGVFRLNVAGGINRSINLGGGALIKDGTCEIRFENPIIAHEFYFNGGHFLSRSTGNTIGTTNFTHAPIYVAATAGQFRTGATGPSYALTNQIILASGANPVFNPDATFYIACAGAVSGAGGLTKSKPGGLFLNTNNTYSGNTIITAGTLSLGVNGSISNSPLVEVRTGATFDASAVPGGFVLASSYTLRGAGTVNGNVTANGTLVPGDSAGTLTFNNDLIIRGNLVLELNKLVMPPNDMIAVTGLLTNAGAGTVSITNIGMHLTTNDVFQIFNQPLPNGNALTFVSAPGYVFTNRLAVDGTIGVLSAPAPVTPTGLKVATAGPTSYTLSAQGGTNSTYFVFATTNITLPFENWWLLGPATSDANGLIQFVDAQATNAARYYRMGQ